MPHLIIDDRTVEVPEGTTVIEAAEQAGIMIPRFCYHKALGSVGACRLCAVSFLAGPVKGLEMSCMVQAEDGMVVSTTAAEAVAYRRQVIEWLMVNHPLDCPVCDEGGQCLLQDETISGGHRARRYPGKKRTYGDQYLGPFIQHEMNRCIHCYRCARFYQEYAGYRDFGVLQIGNRIYYGRFVDGALESPFAGNLVDICPTGVFTDKPARYRARHWDRQRASTVCLHCSLGCNTTVSAFQQAIVSQEARENEAVNGSFICDRGRFGSLFANHGRRPRQPMADGQAVSWPQSLDLAVARLQQIIKASGPGSIAVLGSARSGLETLAMLYRCCRTLDWQAPCFFVDPGIARKISRAIARLDDRSAISLGETDKADCILVIGADPLREGPMLALALRQAARQGTPVVVIDPRPVSLPFAFTHLPAAPGKIEGCLAALVGRAMDREAVRKLDGSLLAFVDALSGNSLADPDMTAQLGPLAGKLKQSRKPLLICGTEVVRETTPDFVADLALLLQAVQGECGLFYLFPEANAYGATLFAGADQPSLAEIVRAIEDGAIKAVIAVETDPLSRCGDRRRLENALANLDLLISLDYLPTPTATGADILLPTANHFESEAHFINQEGRIQLAQPVHRSAMPLSQTGGGGHPPRVYAEDVDEDGPRAAGQVISQLMSALNRESASTPLPDLSQIFSEGAPGLARLRQQPFPVDGLRIVPERHQGAVSVVTAGPAIAQPGDEALELVLTEWTYGTEELSSYSDPIRQATPKPELTMHSEDGARAGFQDGDIVKLHLEQGMLEIPLRLSATMARGVVVLPRHCQLNWQQLHLFQKRPAIVRIEKT